MKRRALTFVKTKPIKVQPEDLKMLVSTGRKAEAYEIAGYIMAAVDLLKKDIQEVQMERPSARSNKTLERYDAIQATYLEMLAEILRRHTER